MQFIVPFAQNRRVLVLAASCAGFALGSAATASTILTFNDLPVSTLGVRMPETYGGLRWGAGLTSWHHMTLASNLSNNFLALSGTSTFFGSPLGGPDFYFEGADFRSRRGLDGNGDFAFVLYHDGVTVYNGMTADNGRVRFDSTWQSFAPDYTGPVDGVAIAFDNDDWDHLAMDNVRITMVPAPGAAAVLGLCGLFANRRRR
jgi:hypothetical protein